MLFRNISTLEYLILSCAVLSGCAGTRQIAVDHPQIQSQPFQPLPGFQGIDGDDYYIRLVSEFDSKGDAVLKSGCAESAPSYEKGDLSAALIYSIRNDNLKFKGEAAGFLYQATRGKCNFKFDAKKLYLTPWIRLNTGKETMVDYNFYTNANSDLDVSALVGDVNAASGLLALTGVGLGVSLMGQIAGNWVANTQQTQAAPTPPPEKHSSETHSLPELTTYTGKSGRLNQAVFKVFDVIEAGLPLAGSETRQIGELKIYPEIVPTVLLKISADGIPDARDLSLEEIGYLPIKTMTGNINLQQLIEQSQHPSKPNLKPDWNNYDDVETNCRNLKRVMKDLGFNKFDRNAMLYYFLAKSDDWKNYNIDRQKVLNDEIRPNTMKTYRSRDFGNCLAADDYSVMKSMGLVVNTPGDWNLIGASSEEKEHRYSPLKSIERQLLAVLKSTNAVEMETQLYPLLTTTKSGDGTVLLQNHLGDFGLEKLLNASGLTAVKAVPWVSPPKFEAAAPKEAPKDAVPQAPGSAPAGQTAEQLKEAATTDDAKPAVTENTAQLPVLTTIPGEGMIVSARQLAQVFTGLLIDELSCSRPIPGQQGMQVGNSGILLFTTREGSPRATGGAMEYEFAGGKITRIAFQLPTYRDFEQDILDRPEVGGCRIEASFLKKFH